MTSPPGAPGHTAPVAAPPAPADAGTRRLGSALFVGGFGWLFLFGATSAVLVPQRVAELAPSGKVATLGILTVVSGVLALVANVVFGALSDRTRTRWGRRTPWILGGAVAAGAVQFALPSAGTTVAFVALAVLANVAMNAHIAALVALVPDRVPASRRGAVSALYGVGQVLGTVAGQVVGAQYIADTAQGFRVTGVVLVVAALVVVLLAPEPPRDAPVGPGRPASPGATAASWRAAVAFPRGAPDFVWALWGRLLLMVGYFVVASYQLYILTDLLRLDVAEAGRTITAIGLAAAVGALLGAAVAGPLSDALGRRKSLVMVSSLLIGAAMVPPLLAPAPGVVVAAAGLAGLGFGIYLAVDTALMTEVLPSSADHAKDMGILNVANSAGQIVAPGVASLVVGVAGYRPLYAVALVLCVASVFCIRPIQGVR